MPRYYDHIDLRVRNLAEVRDFYKVLLPALGFMRETAAGTREITAVGDRRMGARIERSDAPMLGMKTYNKSYIDACRARVDAGLRAYLKQAGKAAVQGVRAAFLQRSGPPSGLYVRAPAHGHQSKGWQSVERGPRPVQLNFAQPGQAAG
jgi:hypothetical protein